MNIFCIPSWYPSESHPIYGIFIREEFELMAQYYPDINYGVSFWGQGDDPSLLWAGRPLSSLKKLLKPLEKNARQHTKNLVEYKNPVYIWTRKLFKGNLRNVFRSNHENLLQFEHDFGKIDLIHAHASYPGAMMASCLSNKYGIPYILTSHMSPFPFREFLKSGRLVSWLDRPVQQAKKVIVPSRWAEQGVKKFGIENTTVIPVIRDLETFTPADYSSNPVPVILAVGRLVPQKGFDLLIEAAADIKQDFIVTIVGEGEQRQKLSKMINKYDLQEKVFLEGEKSRSEVIRRMQSCDFFVLSSRHETFGNVVVEAAACGKPVVVTKCGGPSDIISDRIGIEVEKESVIALKNGIEKMLSIYASYSSKKVREDIIARFDPKVIAKKLRNVYEEVINQNDE